MKRAIYSLCLFALVGCQSFHQSASEHGADVSKANDNLDRLTVGKVQREIKIGMTNADVVQALGSPNIVTTDEQRRESWVYDKVSTNVSFSGSGEGVQSEGRGAGAASRNQKTLTIIIKFDENKKVRDFAYHTSTF